ncbi:uncharacterized protein [Henckelia pumila]|uniref:uncharacterized protein n=1 Tax=Henckelia pumila TaxID=405737 RepID=UPI003C6DE9D2
MGKGKIIHDNIIINDVILFENLFYNLISISQLCDNGYSVEFHQHTCTIKSKNGDIMLTGLREQNTYRINWKVDQPSSPICFVAHNDKQWLWHKHLNHLNFKSISSLSKHELVTGLPKGNFAKDKICSTRHLERRNRTLKEAARTMIADSNVSQILWTEAVNKACYTQNRSMINKKHSKTPYVIWTGKKPDVFYFKVFGCKCYIHNNGKNHLSAFDVKYDEGIFIGYSAVSRAYRVFNKKSLTVEETIHVVFD